MKYYVFPGGGDFEAACRGVCDAAGLAASDDPLRSEFALAPLLRRKLSHYEWSAPTLGTLIFHPSILPYHRGPDAIHWAHHLGERVSGVTWFWADMGLDTGPICEQEAVLLNPAERPGRAYRGRYQPAGLRALARAVKGILGGEPRRVAQDKALASYESFLVAPAIPPR